MWHRKERGKHPQPSPGKKNSGSKKEKEGKGLERMGVTPQI